MFQALEFMFFAFGLIMLWAVPASWKSPASICLSFLCIFAALFIDHGFEVFYDWGVWGCLGLAGLFFVVHSVSNEPNDDARNSVSSSQMDPTRIEKDERFR